MQILLLEEQTKHKYMIHMLCLILSFNCVFSTLPCLTPLSSPPPVTPSGPRQVEDINFQLMSPPRAHSVFIYCVKWEVDDISLCVGVWLNISLCVGVWLNCLTHIYMDNQGYYLIYGNATYCTHTVHIMYTYCTVYITMCRCVTVTALHMSTWTASVISWLLATSHTVHTLYTYCTQTIHILYTYCTHTVHILYTYCTVYITMCRCVTVTALHMSTWTASVISWLLATSHTVHTLYTFCTQTIHILYTYCIVYINMCRCVAVTALRMSTFTTSVISWLMAASHTVHSLYTYCTHT